MPEISADKCPKLPEDSFVKLVEGLHGLLESVNKRLSSVESKQVCADEEKAQTSERISSLEFTIQGVLHQSCRNLEREYLDHPYSLDGQPRCNYEELR